MKKIFAYILFVLLPSFALGQTLVATESVDMGIIAYVNQPSQGQVRLDANTCSYNPSTGASIRKANPICGIVHYLPESSGQAKPVNNKETTLTCVNCASSSCSINYRADRIYPSGLNSEGDFNYGGTITIPANCLAGVYTGVLDAEVKKGSTYYRCNIPIQVTLVNDLNSIIATSEQNLSFGTILVDGAYTVTVGTDGTRTSTKPAAVIAGGTVQQGIFSLNNTTSGAMNVNGVTLDSNITLSNGTSNIAATLASSPSVSSITNVAKGKTYINVGGTLTMTGNETGGTYQGNYTLTVNY